jgi:hypothetical protein
MRRMMCRAPQLRPGALLIGAPDHVMSTTGRRSAEHRERTMLRIAGRTLHRVRDRLLADHDLRLRPETLQQAQHRRLCHRDASGGR